MKYKRLIAFGCSLTYGHGLKDCYQGKKNQLAGDRPSRFAWPALVAEKLGLECVNMSRSGASNKEIWYTCKNFKFEEGDIAVILWTYSNRYCIIEEDGSITELRMNKFKKRVDKAYHLLFRYNDAITDSALRLDDCIHHLNDLQIPNYHLVCDMDDFRQQRNKILPFTMNDIKKNFGKAIDNDHPNEAGHEHFSNLVLNHIKDTL